MLLILVPTLARIILALRSSTLIARSRASHDPYFRVRFPLLGYQFSSRSDTVNSSSPLENLRCPDFEGRTHASSRGVNNKHFSAARKLVRAPTPWKHGPKLDNSSPRSLPFFRETSVLIPVARRDTSLPPTTRG